MILGKKEYKVLGLGGKFPGVDFMFANLHIYYICSFICTKYFVIKILPLKHFPYVYPQLIIK